MRFLPTSALLVLALAGCRGQGSHDAVPGVVFEGTAFDAAARVTLREQPALDHEDLRNVFFLSKRVISGGEPDSEEAFHRLRDWGVKTIISVDGKAPLVDAAARLGMRYVHVPLQYSGMTEEQLLRLAKTFRELTGPFFVHCFHGQHRGPSAAAVGRLVLDQVSREQALAEMRQWMGTSSAYEGLYAVVASGTIPTFEKTQAYEWGFTSAVGVAGIKEAMVMATRAFDNLEGLQENNWTVDPTHPDLVPEQEAQRLAEIFRRSLGAHDLSARPAEFRVFYEGVIPMAEDLASLVSKARMGEKQAAEQSAALMTRIEGSCRSCHEKWRN